VRFLVDNQLPVHLARSLAARGHDAVHVVAVGLDSADDQTVRKRAEMERRIVVSKDEDFFFLANRPGDAGRLLWIRIGNCRKTASMAALDHSLDAVVAAFESGQRIVELS